MIIHLALIMDGNRRWAKANGVLPWLGHRQGAKNVDMVIKYCINQKISYLSLYTFSLENFKRSEQEISYLFALIGEAKSRTEEFIKSGVKVRFVGDLSFLPESTQSACSKIEQATENGSVLQCNFLLCYGGQQEIIVASQRLIDLKIKNVTVDLFKQSLWSGNIPDPDIIVRTGGIQRLSNFLLFQAAYAEIRFLDCMWPDLTYDLLNSTIFDVINAKKNFGR